MGAYLRPARPALAGTLGEWSDADADESVGEANNLEGNDVAGILRYRFRQMLDAFLLLSWKEVLGLRGMDYPTTISTAVPSSSSSA